MRIGFGYDIHQLQEGDKFYLGGIFIPHDKQPVAHSDGDVLIHAICDALLGAANLADIGTHFPDNDPQFKNANSTYILRETLSLLSHERWKVNNLDTTIILERPKLKNYIPRIRTNLATIMNIPEKDISIKATTNEKTGAIGREEAIAAYAATLIYT